jgi:hypothetical protein
LTLIGKTSSLSAEQRNKIVADLKEQWKRDHPDNPAIRRKAIIWMTRKLAERGSDFSIVLPVNCPPKPGSTAIGIPPRKTGEISGVGTVGFDTAIEAGTDAKADVHGTQMIANNCD